MITTLLLAAALQTMPMQNSMAPAPTTPMTDVPRCSATVTDSCMEGGSMGMHKSMKHHAMHKKMMHKKMMHKSMKKSDAAMAPATTK